MAAITTRQTAGTGATVKNSPLTNAEVDNNFININTDLSNAVYITGNQTIGGTKTFSSTITADGGIYRATGNGVAYWLQQDGTGRNHWYWGTAGGLTPTFSNAGEDASSLTLHVTTNGSGGSFFHRSANGVGKNAGDSITWTTTIYSDLNTFSWKGNTVWHAGNDGAGSTLDSDLLDGQQGSYYLDTANLTGTLSAAKGGTGLSSPGTSGNVLTSNGTAWTSAAIPPGGLSYVFKTANYTASNREGVLADTSAGAFTVTLPASPSVGWQVVVVDAGGTWGTNNLTVARNGATIGGTTEDLICDITASTVQLIYDGTTWEYFSQIGGNGGTAVTLAGTQTLTNKTINGTNNTITNVSLTTGVTGTLPVANGGTGQTTTQASINSLAGGVTSGQYLRGNGTNVVMSAIQAADVPTLNQNTTGTASNVTGTVAIANGGTGQTTAQAAMNTLAAAVTSGQYLRGNGTNVVMSAIQAADVPTLNQNTTGNAGTVTNGVYTTGSYADPAWITSLAKSKVGLGNVENTALSTWAGSTSITTIGAATATSLNVTGNLTVNGTTTTVNSTTVTIDDPIFTLGGDTAPAADDNKDRGIEFRWHNGTVAKVGFFGFDDSTGKFTFVPDATNTSEVFSGTKGTLDANVEWVDILSKPNYVASVATTAPLSGGAAGSVGAALTLSLASGYGDTQNPFASKTANTFLAAPNGSAGAPTFRAIVAADIPTLNQNTTGTAANVTGTVAIANGGTGQTTAQAAINALAGAVTSGQYLRGNGTNVVMSAIQAADVPTLNQNTTGTASNVTGTVAIANGGTGATTNTAARTNLGATTVGSNLFTLTNPTAVTFLRVNADNTVSTLDAATFRTAIGAGTSSTTGTVTSVGGTGTVSGLTLSGTVTTTGNLTLGGTLSVAASNFASQTANTVLAAPNGAAGVPTFRALVAADIPTLNQNTTGTAANVTGTVAVANGGTGTTTLAANNVILGNGTSAVQTVAPGTSGNILTSNGSTWTSAAPAGGGFSNMVVFSASGTWTVPAGVTRCKVIVTGAGAGCVNTVNFVGGGGAGGTAIKYLILSGGSATITVGSGATGANIGGTSSFVYNTTTVSGAGGGEGSFTAPGGSASGGDINIVGGDGTLNGDSNTRVSVGGSSYWGGGGGGSVDYNARDGRAYGSGGSGVRQGASTGANGVVVIEY